MIFALFVLFLIVNFVSFLSSSFGLFYYVFLDKRTRTDKFFSVALAVSLALFHLAFFLKALLFYSTDPITNSIRVFLAIGAFTSIFTKGFSAAAAICYLGIVLPIWTAMVNIQTSSSKQGKGQLFVSVDRIRRYTLYMAVCVLILTFATLAATPAYQITIHLIYYPHSLALLYSAIVLIYMNYALIKVLRVSSSAATRQGIYRLLLINTAVFSYSPTYIGFKSLSYLRSLPKDLSLEEYSSARGSSIDLDLELNLLNFTASGIGLFVFLVMLSGPSARKTIYSKLIQPVFNSLQGKGSSIGGGVKGKGETMQTSSLNSATSAEPKNKV